MKERMNATTAKQGNDTRPETTVETLQAENTALRALLADVLDHDEMLEGFNAANLGEELRRRIREAIGR